jgi:hypothetical protein
MFVVLLRFSLFFTTYLPMIGRQVSFVENDSRVLAYASCLWGVYDIYDPTVYCQPPAGKISRSEVRCELPEAKRRAEFTPNETTQKF